MFKQSQQARNSINSLDSLVNILPCERPIKSLQIVECAEKCPPNFYPLKNTLDDGDGDLFKDIAIFGKSGRRYLCISKTEGFKDFVLEKIKIIPHNEHLASEGFMSLKNTADTNQKAWRKKQIVYKLSKIESVTECITDIILLNKFKSPPEGFQYAGELEKVHICFKVAAVKPTIDFTEQIKNLKISSNMNSSSNAAEHYYEALELSYQLPSPNYQNLHLRKAPAPPGIGNTGTLSQYHNDFLGVPFILSPKLIRSSTAEASTIPSFVDNASDALEYDFQLERQILCTTKSSQNRLSTSTNPFF